MAAHGFTCVVAVLASLAFACGASPAVTGEVATDDHEINAERATPGERDPLSATVGAGDSGAPLADAADAAPAVVVTAAAVLAKLTTCATKLSTSPYSRDVGGAANIDVCGLTGAVFFKADLDVDCDGKSTAICNKTTDPSFQSSTAASDSNGQPLDAAALPFIVVPGVSAKWSYKTSGIAMGSVAAVIYNGKIEYGIVGDVGPSAILGEASHAMAKRLGIDPDPKIGGTSSEVVYVIFTGSTGIVKTRESSAEAVTLGEKRAKQLLSEN